MGIHQQQFYTCANGLFEKFQNFSMKNAVKISILSKMLFTYSPRAVAKMFRVFVDKEIHFQACANISLLLSRTFCFLYVDILSFVLQQQLQVNFFFYTQ